MEPALSPDETEFPAANRHYLSHFIALSISAAYRVQYITGGKKFQKAPCPGTGGRRPADEYAADRAAIL